MALGTPVAAAAAYSAAAGATSIAPAYPAGIVATDALILIVGEKPTAANGGTVTTPTGWTLRDQLTGAGGYGATIGADTGNTNLRIYTKDTVTGAETGTLAVTLAAVNVAWGFIVQVPTDGGVFSYGSSDGQRITAPTAGTAFAVALTNGTTATAFANGDLAIWAMCIPTDVTTPGQFSAQSIIATGATFSAATELNEPDNTTGNDIGGYSAWARVTAGSSAVAPTVTVTAGGTVTNVRGPIVLLRVRETLPARTGTFSATESSADGFYSGAKAPVLGAVSFTSTVSPTSISVAYPGGISANDALVVFVAAKLTDSTSVNSAVDSLSVPAGWQYFVSSVTSAGVLAGLDVGDINVTILKKTATGSESGSLTINLVAGSTNVAWASIVRYPAPPSSAAVIVPYINTNSTAFRIGTQEETVSPLSFNVTFPEIVSENNSLFGTKDVFVYALAAASNAYGTNLFSKHTLLDNQNEPDFYTLRPGIQLSEFSTANQTRIAGAVAWTTVNSPETTLPFLGGSVSVELDRKYVSSELYVAYAGVKIRFVPFTFGNLSASETGSDTFAGRPPRPDLGTRTGSFAATESADRLTNIFGDSVSGYVTSLPVVGTVAYSATTTISPAYPAGIAANSVIVMFVAQKPSTANGGTITTPAGWTLQGESLAGGGYGTTLGIDTGNQNLWVFTKTAVTGTETGTVAVTLATTNSAWAAIASVQRSNSHPISLLPYAGESVTPSSIFYAVNAPTVANPGGRIDAKEGDIVLFAASIASDSGTPANFSNFAINDLSGFSLHTTLSELAEPDSAGGSDIGGLIGWTQCVFSQGFSSSALEVTADVVDATNSAGPTLALRVRVEYPPATGNLAATEAADTFAAAGSASAAATSLTAARYDNTQVFYSPTVTRGAVTLTPGRYDNPQVIYAATATPGAASLTATRYDNAPIFYAPTVTHGAVTLTPGRYDNAQVIYAATVTIGAAGLTAARYDNAQAFYAASATVGAVGLTTTRYDNAQAFYAPSVANGAVALQPGRYDNSQTLYAAAVSQASGPQALTPPRLDNVNVFYGATLLLSGNQALAPPLLQNTQTFFAAALSLAIGNPSGNAGGQVAPKPRKARPAWIAPPPDLLGVIDEEDEALLLVGAI